MPRIAVFGGTGYLASLLKNQNKIKKNNYIFFSRKKNTKNYIDSIAIKKKISTFKNLDIIIHLAGPNQNQLRINKDLLKKKNQLTSDICNLCLVNNIKLIYISSLQVYKNYGIKNLIPGSEINFKNIYSKAHYQSEKIIISKFKNKKKMFTILRMGNIFGFLKFEKNLNLKDNLINSLCISALKKKKIILENSNIQRTLIPSKTFVKIINLIIQKKFFHNSIENIFFKNFTLQNIAEIIQKRSKILLGLRIKIKNKKNGNRKKFNILPNPNFKLAVNNKKIYFEIDQILKYIQKKIR